MRLLSYEHGGKATFGAVDGDGVVDLGARLEGRFAGLKEALAAGALNDLRDTAASASADHSLGDISYLRPIPYPEKIFCIGVNYMNRNAEYNDGSEQPKYPSLFMRSPETLVPHGAPILRPPESEQLDYEGEIAVVIGKEGRRIAREAARDHIAGITCLNEGTIRDWLRHGKFNVTQGKNFDRTGAIGPWITTSDEVDSFDDLQVTTRVNGEVRQDDNTGNLAFPFDHLISYLSTFATLKPGDVIATGTPIGAGVRFDPPRFLKPGDALEIEVSGVGVLRNLVEDEQG